MSRSTQMWCSQKSSHLKMIQMIIKNGRFKRYWIPIILMDYSTTRSNGKATLKKKLSGNLQKTLEDLFIYSRTTTEQILAHLIRIQHPLPDHQNPPMIYPNPPGYPQ